MLYLWSHKHPNRLLLYLFSLNSSPRAERHHSVLLDERKKRSILRRDSCISFVMARHLLFHLPVGPHLLPCLSLSVFLCLPVCLSVCLCLSVTACLSVYQSLGLSVCLVIVWVMHLSGTSFRRLRMQVKIWGAVLALDRGLAEIHRQMDRLSDLQ